MKTLNDKPIKIDMNPEDMIAEVAAKLVMKGGTPTDESYLRCKGRRMDRLRSTGEHNIPKGDRSQVERRCHRS